MRSGSTWRADAPAKLNLFLEVTGRREDGYHEIETLMVATSIYDTLYFTPDLNGPVNLAVHWADGVEALRQRIGRENRGVIGPRGALRAEPLEQIPSGPDNLVYRAVELFRDRAGISAGAGIRLIKRIPAAAGLGGASSDAAAALFTANRAWGVHWPLSRLREVAAELGSDIPFFLPDSPAVMAGICRGRGEVVSHRRFRGRLHCVIVHPPASLSTALVYQRCQPAAQPHPLQPSWDALRAGNSSGVGRQLFNRLEVAASELSPWIPLLKERFQRLNLSGFRMSGSGSSLFGICRDARHAGRVARLLRGAGLGRAFAASTVSPHCRIAATST